MLPGMAGQTNGGQLLLEYMTENQERENFYHSSYVHEGFISAISLLNDLMKIFVGLGIFNHVIFKNLGSDCF